ncbi:MAG TPA: hypothetical protein DDY77_03255 [Clostridiales bacterium]|nr:hypothetical protein [Clostridiales bacterium]
MSITSYVFSLASLSLVASFASILCPDGNFKKPCEKVAALAIAVTTALLAVSFFTGKTLGETQSANYEIAEDTSLSEYIGQYSLERKKRLVKSLIESDGLTLVRADFTTENGEIKKVYIYIEQSVINGFSGNINISEEERKIASSLSVKKEAVTIFGDGKGKENS